MGSDDHALLAEQIAYYRAGAAEYDRPYAERQDLQDLLTVTADLPIGEDVMELACRTGQWTTMLAARARSVTAADAAAETLAIARSRAASPHVRFIQFTQADMFEWWSRRGATTRCSSASGSPTFRLCGSAFPRPMAHSLPLAHSVSLLPVNRASSWHHLGRIARLRGADGSRDSHGNGPAWPRHEWHRRRGRAALRAGA